MKYIETKDLQGDPFEEGVNQYALEHIINELIREVNELKEEIKTLKDVK